MNTTRLHPCPVFHWLTNGNYISCNLYWAVGLDCPHCAHNATMDIRATPADALRESKEKP